MKIVNYLKRMIKLLVLASLFTVAFSYLGYVIGRAAIEWMSDVELYIKTLPDGEE